MSQQLINRSPDLLRLRDEGYDLGFRSGYLLIRNIPYVSSDKTVKNGMLVSELTLAGDVTTTPKDHVVRFSGDRPCHKDGSEITQIINSSNREVLDHDLVVDHLFSSKPTSGSYRDFHEKMTTYIAIISSPAVSIDPTVTPRIFPVIESEDEKSVFKYIDTASSRAGINVASKKLELEKIAIVGLGGTGSYILDLVAKTLVKEIHLFDGDRFSQHNAFRSPGAPSLDDLNKKTQKAVFFQEQYSRMRSHIIAHDCYVNASNIDFLRGMDFVFLCLDNGTARKLLVDKLEEFAIPFIDVGMGIYQVEGSLGGILRTTTSTIKQREHVRAKGRIPFSDGNDNDEYSRNIQIADLNALNAALAVIKWKKLFGFYLDLENEHYSAYVINGNVLINEDQA